MDRQAISINEMRGIQQCAAPRPTGLNEEQHAEIAAQVAEFQRGGGVIQVLPNTLGNPLTVDFNPSRYFRDAG